MRKIEIALSLAFLIPIIAAVPASATPTVTTINTFNGADGADSVAPLIQGTDGLLYGMTLFGGANSDGNVFSIDEGGGTLTDLLDFDGTLTPFGREPEGSVVQGSDGNLYGTTAGGGAHNAGTVFKVAPDGTGYVDLYDFGAAVGDAESPVSLIRGSDGSFYGTAVLGGANDDGVVFKISSSGGSITILHSFGPNDLQGALAPLVEGEDGSLYGTTAGGGINQNGGIFRINLDGSGYTVLHAFAGGASDGSNSQAGLTPGGDGFLYGTTEQGGANGVGTVFKIKPDGTGYQTMYSFAAGTTDANSPKSGLALGNDENLYGAGLLGGPANEGGLFEIGRKGTADTLLYSFASTGGFGPQAGLLPATNGLFYGTTNGGAGAQTDGIIFSLDNGLPLSPTGLYALGSDAQVQLFWNTDTNADVNAGFNLYRSTTSGGEGNTPYQTNLLSPQFFDNNVSQGTTYYYQVTAFDLNGIETSKSYEVAATPQMSIASSGGLTAAPNPVVGSKSTTGTLTLTQATTSPTIAFVSSDNPNVTFASSDVTVPASSASTNFTINTNNIGSPYTATITASENGTDASTTITVNVPSILHTFQSGLQMISAPTDDTGITIANDFGDSNAELAAWTGSAYAVTPTAPADTIVPGQGYWFDPGSTANLYDIGADTNPALPVSLSLVAGWNMIGDPFNAATAASSLQVMSSTSTLSFANANLAGLVGATFYTWQPGDSAYEAQAASSATLQPFEGYWLFAFQPCTLIVPVPGGH